MGRLGLDGLKRARALFATLFDQAPEKVSTEGFAPAHVAAARPLPVRSALLADPHFLGVGASRSDEGVLLSWRTTETQLRDAGTLATGPRSLRIVLVRAAEEDVAVDTLDLGEVPAEGARLLPDVPGLLRAVASIGLFDGERFVSMAHGSVA
jgi:hypothetical protein